MRIRGTVKQHPRSPLTQRSLRLTRRITGIPLKVMKVYARLDPTTYTKIKVTKAKSRSTSLGMTGTPNRTTASHPPLIYPDPTHG